MSTENSLLENDEPVLIKRHFLMEVRVLKIKKNTVFLNHFNLCKKSGDDTANIETLYFQTVFDICISDKFLDKDQSFQDTLCHKH